MNRTTSLVIISFIMVALVAFIITMNSPGRISANETGAIGVMKQLTSSEAIFQCQGPDGNGLKDYWTYDVSCFYRMYRLDGVSRIEFEPLDVALADAKPADYTGGIKPFGDSKVSTIEPWPDAQVTPRYGYLFRAMLTDQDGNLYNQNPVGANKILATNSDKYGFVAYPVEYGVSGVRTFIVNEGGTVFGTDCGSDAAKVVLTWPTELKWVWSPVNKKPPEIIGPGGKFWHIAE